MNTIFSSLIHTISVNISIVVVINPYISLRIIPSDGRFLFTLNHKLIYCFLILGINFIYLILPKPNGPSSRESCQVSYFLDMDKHIYTDEILGEVLSPFVEENIPHDWIFQAI